MAYDFSSFKKALTEKQEWLSKELLAVRTGRATPALLDGVQVEIYGSRTPINQAAGVSVEDARTVRISPWDAANIKPIEKAITTADLGVSVVVDDRGLRVVFPELTGERRQQLVKLVREKFEEARVAVRSAREECWGDIQKKEKDGGISEDDKFRAKDEMEKLVKEGNEKLEAIAKKKEEEVTTL